MRTWWWQAGVLALCLAVAGGGGAVIAYDQLVGHGPAVATASAPVAQRSRTAHPKAKEDREPKPRKGSARAARKAPPKHPPEERAAIRVDSRDQAVDALLDRVEQHATTANWDDDTLQAVEEELVASAEATSDSLAQVDRGEVTWDAVRAQVRQDRLDSAARVQKLLGKDRFDAMVADVGLQRFMGDEPIRGRIDNRVAGGERALGTQ